MSSFNYSEELAKFEHTVIDDPEVKEHRFLDDEYQGFFHNLWIAVRHMIGDYKGFSYQSKRSRFRKNTVEYWVYVPVKKVRKRLSWATKLTLKHEYGHVVCEYLYRTKNSLLFEIMDRMRERKKFRRLQRFYYWNPVLRWFKRMLGFSSKISYKRDDHWEVEALRTGLTREDNEFFCDCFAWCYGSFYTLMKDTIKESEGENGIEKN